MVMRFIFLASVVLLTACTPPVAQIVSQDSNALVINNAGQELTKNDKPLTSPTSWDLSGAMAARNANKAWSASINWLQQGPSNYQIRLFGPLGSGAVLIQKQNGLVSFKDGHKQVTSNNADELLNQQTGIRLPVNNLYYWVRGIPAPGKVGRVERDGANRLVMLQQAGYTISYLNYSAALKASLPSQIKLQGHGVSIKLVIKQWKI